MATGLVAALAIVGALGIAAPPSLVIEVDAGAHDRRGTPVRLEVPKDPAQVLPFYKLEALDGGQLVPGELHAGLLTWALDVPLPAGSKRRYRLTRIPPPVDRRDLPPTVIGSPFGFDAAGSLFRISVEPDAIRMMLDGRAILDYHRAVAEPPGGIDPLYRRSGFIHPIATRSGLVVTDDFPPDHPHQHGLFFAWVDTTFRGRKVDFWNQHNRTGRVRHGDGETFSGGPISGDFHAWLVHEALNTPGGPASVLKETWGVTAYSLSGAVVLDFESKQECAGPEPLKINKYHYGGLGFRGNRQWYDPGAKGDDPPDPARSGRVEFLTGEGKHRPDGNHTRPRWVDLSGEVDGRVGGIAILDHPGNFRYPQPVRLHPNKPYFSFAPAVLGDFEIVPGKPYISRYRLVVHDGRPDPALIERLRDDYADPPRARIVPEGG